MLLFFALGAGLVLQPACASRQRGASAAGAFIDCEAPHIAKLLPDLIPIAKEAVMAAIAGDGSVDTARLRADAAAIRGDLGNCAIAAAVAALATPAMAGPEAPMSAELVLDAARLRGAFAQVRGELGWAEVHVAGRRSRCWSTCPAGPSAVGPSSVSRPATVRRLGSLGKIEEIDDGTWYVSAAAQGR